MALLDTSFSLMSVMLDVSCEVAVVFGWQFFRRRDASLLSSFRPHMAWLLLFAFGKLNSLHIFHGVMLLFLSSGSVRGWCCYAIAVFVHAVDFSSVSLLSPVGGLMAVCALHCPVLLWSGFSLTMG
jgi:hypothetical protein